MKIPEFIQWLKIQDQTLTVEVLAEDVDYGFDGENEYSSSFVYGKIFDEDCIKIDKRAGTLLLGEKW